MHPSIFLFLFSTFALLYPLKNWSDLLSLVKCKKYVLNIYKITRNPNREIICRLYIIILSTDTIIMSAGNMYWATAVFKYYCLCQYMNSVGYLPMNSCLKFRYEIPIWNSHILVMGLNLVTSKGTRQCAS